MRPMILGWGFLEARSHQLFPGRIQQVQETGIALGHMGYQIDDFVQDVRQVQVSADCPADLVQDGDFPVFESQGGSQLVGVLD